MIFKEKHNVLMKFFSNFLEMILLLMEQDDCIMTYFMFQDQYGIEIFVENQEKDCQGAHKGTMNVDICSY